MASAFSHAFVALTLGKITSHRAITWPVLLTGAVCSMVPDLDVIGFAFGIPYGDLWGHRGMTHSLFFAGLLSAGFVGGFYRDRARATQLGIFGYLFVCTASHGVLDALTDGGLGIAFFSPFDPTRYFFPSRPVAVSPIGIGEFFSLDALHILASEFTWIWLPSMGMLIAARILLCLWLTIPRPDSPTRDQ
ncbi:MAG: metal-dependent hydrolase [Nitrospira sp.]|nr:metal-dependent hydrolase [Nitrospira sp.]